MAMVDRLRRCWNWREVLPCLSVLAWISTAAEAETQLAIAAPVSPACTRPAMIVFDGSGSMMAATNGESRLQSAKRAMAEIAPPASAIRPLGLTVYSGNFNKCDNVRLLVAPARDSGLAILDALADVQPGGATPLGAAVRLAVSYFRERAEAATLVVVTDGEENCGDDICALADETARGQPPMDVHVIGYGLDTGQEQSLRCLSSRNGGRYTTVNTTRELIDALSQALGCPAVALQSSGPSLAALARYPFSPQETSAKLANRPKYQTSLILTHR